MPSPPVALCVLLVPWKLSAGIQVTHSRDINQSSRQLRDPYPLRHLDLACVNWNSGRGEPFWGLVCWSNGRGAPRRCVEANTVLWGLWGSRPAVTGGTGLRGGRRTYAGETCLESATLHCARAWPKCIRMRDLHSVCRIHATENSV